MLGKWIFDRVVAAIGLVALSPLLLAVAALIAIKMPGAPVLFRQRRVGRGAKLFTIYKFRTMTAGGDGITVAAAEQERITPLGAKLRRLHIDELPELWNVLIGQMSLVGPRPDVPGYADMLEGDDSEVLQLRPGITGPASLKYRNEEEMLAKMDNPLEYNDRVIFPDKVRINRYYLHHYSFVMDLRIILATVLGKHIEYNGETI